MLDEDGYPTNETLERIRTWEPRDGPGLLEFVRSIWWAADWGVTHEGHRWFLSTGGWSGNEEVIQAMKENRFWWSFHWQASRRGGHFEFKARPEHVD